MSTAVAPTADQLGDDDLLLHLEADGVHGAAGVGWVLETGARATNLVTKRVLFGAVDPCGECDICRRGGAPVCPLARRRRAPLAEQIIVASRWITVLDEGLELAKPIAARVPGDMTLAYTLYARSNLAPREPTVVVGRGDVAKYLVQILRAKKIEPTVVVEPGEPLEPSSETMVVAVDDDARELHARVLATFAARAIGTRPWRVVCASPDAIVRAASLCGPRAQLTILAGGAPLPGELLSSLADREVTIVTVAAPHPDLVVEVAAMCVKRELTL
ncbi:MAG: alcohol dehydrogenase catalytic domain-containing protein [Proteobacteria bacterium]|nr:alcohol dehydrogenase catalytic domain-containing protein [Pseudomonadota bacterium]